MIGIWTPYEPDSSYGHGLYLPNDYDPNLLELPLQEDPILCTATLLNATTAAIASSNTGVITIPSTTAGSLIVVCIGLDTARTLTSIIDSTLANTYTNDKNQTGTNCASIIGSSKADNGGATSVTVVLSGTAVMRLTVLEFSTPLTPRVGTSSVGTAASGTAVAVASFNPTVGNLIVAIGSAGGSRTWTKDAAYTKGDTDSGSLRSLSQYLLSCTGTETAPMTISSSAAWAEVAVEYNYVVAATGSNPSVARRRQFMQHLAA